MASIESQSFDKSFGDLDERTLATHHCFELVVNLLALYAQDTQTFPPHLEICYSQVSENPNSLAQIQNEENKTPGVHCWFADSLYFYDPWIKPGELFKLPKLGSSPEERAVYSKPKKESHRPNRLLNTPQSDNDNVINYYIKELANYTSILPENRETVIKLLEEVPQNRYKWRGERHAKSRLNL